MAQKHRSPFGEVVHAHRTALNLTRAQLANQTSTVPGATGSVSVRTIAHIERRYAPGEEWSVHHSATVAILAGMLGLQPGSTEWLAFHEASLATRMLAPPARTNSQATADPGQAPTGPFVDAGREAQLARLLTAAGNVVAGNPEVLLVAGELGSGKTTLIAHACRTMVDRHQDLVVLWGSSTVDPAPYQVSAQLVNVAMMQVEHTSPIQRVSAGNLQNLQRRLPRTLHTLANEGPALIERVVPMAVVERFQQEPELAPYLARLTEGGPVPADQHEFMEQIWRSLAAYADAGPVVLVFENLHLADESSTSVFHFIAKRLSTSPLPVLLIGSYRPFDLVPGTGTSLPPFAPVSREIQHYFLDSTVNLDAATGGQPGRDYVDAVIRSRVHDAPPTLAEEVFALTEGLPLFVESVLHWYQVEGALLPTPSLDTLRWSQTPVSLPQELMRVLADLYASLGKELQEILDAASVQGIVFSADVLQHVLGLSRADLIDRLVTSLTRQVRVMQPAGIRTIGDRRSYDYEYVHALLGELVYRRLPPPRKTLLHQRTAEAMRDLWGDTIHTAAHQIARQYDLAGDARSAGKWYLRAGDYHLLRHEFRQAIPYYQRLRDLNLAAIDPYLAAQALVGLGNCARGEGDLAKAQACLETAHTFARENEVHEVEANALTSLGMVRFDSGELARGEANLRRAVEVLTDLGDEVETCRTRSLLSYLLLGQGKYDEAAWQANESIETATSLGQDDLYVRGLLSLSDCRLALGAYREVIDLCQQSLRISEEHGYTVQTVLGALSLSHALIELGRPDDAQQAVDRVFALRHVANRRMVAAAHYDQGRIAILRGELDQARNHFMTALTMREANQQRALTVDAEAGLLQVALATDDISEVKQRSDSLRHRLATQGTDGIEQPAHLFLNLVQAGDLLHDGELVREALHAGASLLRERAARMGNADDRRAYLDGIPLHRDLLMRAAADD